jgi:ribosomal protein S15P/S13E
MARQKKLETKEKSEETKKENINVEKTIIELAKSGLTSEKIGLVLKEKHGIKNVRKETGKKITQILKENDAFVDADIKNLKEIIESSKKHIEKNKHDYVSKRMLPITASKLRRFEKYRKA